MSRREEKAAATRAQFVNATFLCLVEAGYHGTTTVAVCERAKLARGTMLHHFPTKEALVLAALEDVLVRRVDDFRLELAGADTADLPGLVSHLWAALRGTFHAHQGLQRLQFAWGEGGLSLNLWRRKSE